jgi:hypothetical protein
VRCGSPARDVACRVCANTSPDVSTATLARPRRPPKRRDTSSRYANVASRSASMTACMSSARPITPNTARDFWAPITNSMPGLRVAANRTPHAGWDAPLEPNTAL